MKYKLTTTRTYVTEMIVVAESESDAWDWVNENSDLVAEAELEQMNVMYDESTLEPVTPARTSTTSCSHLPTTSNANCKHIGTFGEDLGFTTQARCARWHWPIR
jgi:hypothetical protein